MLQSVFVGKAQKVCSELSMEQSSDYEEVKALVLTAYELVPESYRQKFRNWKRKQGHTYVITPKKRNFGLIDGITLLVRRKALAN